MKILGIFLILLFSFGCDSVDSENPVVYPSDLQVVYKEMVSLSESENCSNSEDWLYTPYGAKACGGPIGYIAYSKNIDQDYFLGLVDKFTELQEDYNKKTGAVSDCALAIRPTGIACENGKPKLIYS